MDENLKALDIKWTQEIEDKLEAILKNGPEPTVDYRTLQMTPSRRSIAIKKE